MRRLIVLLVALLVGVPAVAGPETGAGASSSGGSAGSPGPFPDLVDLPGPAHVDPAVTEAADRLPGGSILELVVSLGRPAGEELEAALADLGAWSWTFRHVPAAAVRLPVERLGALRDLEGILGIYLNERLRYYLDESDELLNTARARDELGVTGKGVTVAVLDTGVDFTHPDLAPALRANVKLLGPGRPGPFVPMEGLVNSDTSSGHGTHVAGDVAGRGTASDGLYRGIAPGAGLVGIGAGDGLNILFALEGLEWIMANREQYDIRVVNNSWGTQFTPYDPFDPINRATQYLAEAGIVVVFANGNDGTEMSMNPYAAAPWVLPVAAGTSEGEVASFSSGGIEADTVGEAFADVDEAGETRHPLAMGLYHPAVVAPGVDIVSTRSNTTLLPALSAPGDVQDVAPEHLPYYTTATGTSMAAPQVAGLAALVLEAAPELDPLQVRRVLQVTARPIPDAPFHFAGYGYADASVAVELARSLHGRSPAAIQQELERLQGARDAEILTTLAHPAHTYATTVAAPTGVGAASREVTVPASTSRLKVASNGGNVPFAGSTHYQITVTDAAGRVVGQASAADPSGATILDINLSDVRDLEFGEWTVEIFAIGSPGTPSPGVGELFAKTTIDVLVSVFGPADRPGAG